MQFGERQRRLRDAMIDQATPGPLTLEITEEAYQVLREVETELVAAQQRQQTVLRTILADARITKAHVVGVQMVDGKVILSYVVPNGGPPKEG